MKCGISKLICAFQSGLFVEQVLDPFCVEATSRKTALFSLFSSRFLLTQHNEAAAASCVFRVIRLLTQHTRSLILTESQYLASETVCRLCQPAQVLVLLQHVYQASTFPSWWEILWRSVFNFCEKICSLPRLDISEPCSLHRSDLFFLTELEFPDCLMDISGIS